MNTATIRFFTLPLKKFLARVTPAHFGIFVIIRLPVTVEFFQLFQAKLLGVWLFDEDFDNLID